MCSDGIEFSYLIARENWIWGNKDDLLINQFEIREEDERLWRLENPRFWLIYISVLCEHNNYEKAKYILNKYVSVHGLKYINDFFLVSDLAYKMEFTNVRIHRAELIYEQIQENIQKNIFGSFIKNKNIAIIGNGPCELGRKKGIEIDNHDIVIRFNNYELKNHEDDYGSKTDIWMNCVWNDKTIVRVDENKDKLCIFGGSSYLRNTISEPEISMIEKIIKYHKNNIYYFPRKNNIKLKEFAKIPAPSSGLIMIWNVLNEMDRDRRLDLYGFSYLYGNSNKSGHYYADKTDWDFSMNFDINHNFDGEAEIIMQLFKESGIKSNVAILSGDY